MTVILVAALASCSRSQATTPAGTPTKAPSATTQTLPTTAPGQAATTRPATGTTAASGMSAAEFYRTNVVTIVVPYGAGGNTDYAARMFAANWNEVTGGRMIVDNKAGAGGMLAANYTYIAKPDGLTMGVAIPGSGLISAVLMRDPAIKYDIKKMNWIEYVNPEGYGFSIGTKLPYDSMQSLSKVKGLKFASSGRNSSGGLGAGLLIDIFGLQDAKIVPGYGGTTDAFLAIAKGEVDAYVTGNAVITDGVNKGFLKKSLVTMDFQRNPYFPDTPIIPEMLKLTPQQETLLGTFGASITGQGFWFPPGVPQDRTDFARAAFDKIVTLENYARQSRIIWPVSVKPTPGKDFADQIAKVLAIATPETYNELLKLADRYQ